MRYNYAVTSTCSSNLITVALQLDFSIVWLKYILRKVISEAACLWLQYEVKKGPSWVQ